MELGHGLAFVSEPGFHRQLTGGMAGAPANRHGAQHATGANFQSLEAGWEETHTEGVASGLVRSRLPAHH